jgi:MarR family transcriptional regulator, lower aerobic nicotinate degradation pathway regulator
MYCGGMLNPPSRLLTQTAAYASRIIADGMARVHGRVYHYRLLVTLAQDGPASQAELGRRTGIHLSDMVAAINELATGGYVSREPDPGDRRRNVVTITAAGRKRMTELAATVDEIQEELLEPLSAGERAELTRLLTKLVAHHGAGVSAGDPAVHRGLSAP